MPPPSSDTQERNDTESEAVSRPRLLHGASAAELAVPVDEVNKRALLKKIGTSRKIKILSSGVNQPQPIDQMEEMALVAPRPNYSTAAKQRRTLLLQLLNKIPSYSMRLQASAWVASLSTRFAELEDQLREADRAVVQQEKGSRQAQERIAMLQALLHSEKRAIKHLEGRCRIQRRSLAVKGEELRRAQAEAASMADKNTILSAALQSLGASLPALKHAPSERGGENEEGGGVEVLPSVCEDSLESSSLASSSVVTGPVASLVTHSSSSSTGHNGNSPSNQDASTCTALVPLASSSPDGPRGRGNGLKRQRAGKEGDHAQRRKGAEVVAVISRLSRENEALSRHLMLCRKELRRAHKSLSKCQDELQSRPKGKGPRATDPASGLEASADEAGQDEPQTRAQSPPPATASPSRMPRLFTGDEVHRLRLDNERALVEVATLKDCASNQAREMVELKKQHRMEKKTLRDKHHEERQSFSRRVEDLSHEKRALQASVSFTAHQLDRVKRLLVQQEKLNTHLAQMLIEKGHSSTAVARAYHISTQLSPANESGSNNSSNNGGAKKGGAEGEKEASHEGPEGPEAPEDDGIMVVVPTERSIASASLASHHKIKPPRSAADTDAGYELSLHLATYTELTACQSELQEARRRLRKEEERGQALQRHGALLGRQLREREDELAQAKSAAERVTVAEARAQALERFTAHLSRKLRRYEQHGPPPASPSHHNHNHSPKSHSPHGLKPPAIRTTGEGIPPTTTLKLLSPPSPSEKFQATTPSPSVSPPHSQAPTLSPSVTEEPPSTPVRHAVSPKRGSPLPPAVATFPSSLKPEARVLPSPSTSPIASPPSRAAAKNGKNVPRSPNPLAGSPSLRSQKRPGDPAPSPHSLEPNEPPSPVAAVDPVPSTSARGHDTDGMVETGTVTIINTTLPPSGVVHGGTGGTGGKEGDRSRQSSVDMSSTSSGFVLTPLGRKMHRLSSTSNSAPNSARRDSVTTGDGASDVLFSGSGTRREDAMLLASTTGRPVCLFRPPPVSDWLGESSRKLLPDLSRTYENNAKVSMNEADEDEEDEEEGKQHVAPMQSGLGAATAMAAALLFSSSSSNKVDAAAHEQVLTQRWSSSSMQNSTRKNGGVVPVSEGVTLWKPPSPPRWVSEQNFALPLDWEFRNGGHRQDKESDT